MENNEIVDPDKKSAKIVGITNAVSVGIMILCCFNENTAFMAFFFGILAAIANFIMMIIFIAQRRTISYIICIISMLLLPIIGFGCCAVGVKNMNF